MDLILRISTREGNLTTTLLGPAGQLLASAPVTLDISALEQMVGPEAHGRALTGAILGGEAGQALQQAAQARVRLVVAGHVGEVEFVQPPVSLDRICQALENEPNVLRSTGLLLRCCYRQ